MIAILTESQSDKYYNHEHPEDIVPNSTIAITLLLSKRRRSK